MIKLQKLLKEVVDSRDYLETGEDIRFAKRKITPYRQEQEYCNECGTLIYENRIRNECECVKRQPQPDHEVFMAQKSLKEIQSAAQSLMAKLGEDEKDIPAWIQDHITNAENYIKQANEGFYEQAQY